MTADFGTHHINWLRWANSSLKSHVLIFSPLFYPACLLTDPTGSVGVKQIWRLVCKKFIVFCNSTVFKSQRTKTLLLMKNTKQLFLEPNWTFIMGLAFFMIFFFIWDTGYKITSWYAMHVLSEKTFMFILFWTKLDGILKVHQIRCHESGFIQGPSLELLISCPPLSYPKQIEIKGDCVTACCRWVMLLLLSWCEPKLLNTSVSMNQRCA